MTTKPAPNTLPPVTSAASPEDVLARLETAARRGKLPGFARTSATSFSLTDFGAPFESRLSASVSPSPAGSVITFDPPRLKPLFPWAFAAILILTVWPGVWLTDSMIRSYWDWYSSRPDWLTYAWYIPLTLPFCPFAMRSALRKSRDSADAEMPDIMQKVTAAAGGQASPGPG